MSNPFENYDIKKSGSKSYRAFVKNQVEEMKVGQSKKMDLKGASYGTFRSSLSSVQKEQGKLFKTKCNENGELWALRYK